MPALSADMERRLVCPAHTNYFKWFLIYYLSYLRLQGFFGLLNL